MIVYLVVYAALAVFLVAVIARAIKIATLPLHLRWELYPVAHEKNTHGGSYLENVDWWKKPRESSAIGELKVMVPEIVLLKGVYEHNRPLWMCSFPFHFGLYLLSGFLVLLLVGAIAHVTGTPIGPEASTFGLVVHWATLIVGLAGLVMMPLGALALLMRRMGDPALRSFSAPADLVNLGLFIVASLVALAAFGVADQDFASLRLFVAGLVTFNFSVAGSLDPLVAAEIIAGAVLFAYIPLTHMSHFFTKWFLYHDIRWEDEANEVGSRLEARIQQQLEYKVDWAAAHIQGGGKKNWVDVATEEVAKK